MFLAEDAAAQLIRLRSLLAAICGKISCNTACRGVRICVRVGVVGCLINLLRRRTLVRSGAREAWRREGGIEEDTPK